ncbi:LysR substrate-binding domain-containing protein [Streptomyces xantholiticus]|uniref:LysR substrate-binding domain-containing protein n=1 Tax=Streptomyces xantholiticus TaxID=68285 RepID=A0ABV1V3W1_9ACTN
MWAPDGPSVRGSSPTVTAKPTTAAGSHTGRMPPTPIRCRPAALPPCRPAVLPLRHSAAEAAGPLDLADLAGAPWVWLHRHISPDYHDAMATLCRAAGFSPVPTHWARSVTSQIAMVECGLGVTVVPAPRPRHTPPSVSDRSVTRRRPSNSPP